MLGGGSHCRRLEHAGRAIPRRPRRTLNKAATYAGPTGADFCQLRRYANGLPCARAYPFNVLGLSAAPTPPNDPRISRRAECGNATGYNKQPQSVPAPPIDAPLGVVG